MKPGFGENVEYARNFIVLHGQSLERAYPPLPNAHRIVARIIRWRRRAGRKLQRIAASSDVARIMRAFHALQQ